MPVGFVLILYFLAVVQVHHRLSSLCVCIVWDPLVLYAMPTKYIYIYYVYVYVYRTVPRSAVTRHASPCVALGHFRRRVRRDGLWATCGCAAGGVRWATYGSSLRCEVLHWRVACNSGT